MPETKIESPLACDLTAIPSTERESHILTAKELLQAATHVRETSDGYALQLPNDSNTLLSAAKYIDHERECCPFFGFAIELEPERGALWLKLTGRDGVKEFLREELSGQVQPDVARAANFR